MTTAVEGTLPAREGSLSVHVASESASATAEKRPEKSVDHLAVASSSATTSSKDSNSDAETSTGSSSGRGQADFQVADEGGKFSGSPGTNEDSRFLPKKGVVVGITSSCSDDVIDSALLAALKDPRERLGLLKLEQAMVDFMNTSDGYIEVGGPFNSVVISPTGAVLAGASSTSTDRQQTMFQRCILHRLADRFSIIRETGSHSEGFIRLVKLKDSKLPKKLLLNLEESEYNASSVEEVSKSVDHMSFASPGQTGYILASNANATNSSKSRQRKMKIMKRNSSGDSFKSSGNNSADSRSTSRKGKNFSDKEKAYAEARARIFSDQQGDNGGTIPPASTESVPPALTAVVQPGASSQSSLDNAVATDDNDEDSRKGRGQRAGGTVSKATWRNRRQEENDPDFQRGGHISVQQTYGADVYGGYTGGGTAGYPAQQSHQPKFYPTYSEDTTAYYGGPNQQASQLSQQQPPYYGHSGRGRGRSFGASPRYVGYGSNNNYYHQTHQHPHYHQSRATSAETANVNSLEDFPSLR